MPGVCFIGKLNIITHGCHQKNQGGFRKNKRQKHSLICNDYKQNRPQTESAILRFLQYLKNKNSHHKLPDKTF